MYLIEQYILPPTKTPLCFLLFSVVVPLSLRPGQSLYVVSVPKRSSRGWKVSSGPLVGSGNQ